MNLYLLMTALFLGMAGLIAVDAALTSYTLLPWFNGLRWLRVHFITLGALAETIFGLLPAIVAIHAGLPRPKFRWDIWLPLNIGLLALFVGIPIINQALIFSGGTLVFVATLQLLVQVRGLRRPAPAEPESGSWAGRPFYLSGLSFLLLGILIGTGLWLGWNDWMQMQRPIEVHIHANNWGFMALVFAGLLVDLYPSWAARPLANPSSVRIIFWLMTLGGVGLVLGPWVGSSWFTVPGILAFLIATFWLLYNVIKPLWGDTDVWSRPGPWHILTAYLWILAPVLVAPLILLGVPGFPGPSIEANAPQALIYGWVLQFGFAIIPYSFERLFLPSRKAQLGGSWISLLLVNLGGILLWAGIFLPAYQGLLHGTAYLLWALSMVPIIQQVWRSAASGLSALEERPSAAQPAPAAD